jgi:DnaJ-domain-containing protein 1
VNDFRIDESIVDRALRRQLGSRIERLELLADARVRFRVAIRPPRSALTESPLLPSSFLAGRKRARDAADKTPRPTRTRSPHASVAPEFPGDRERRAALLVLGVTVGSDDTEIRRAYRKLARAFHPDLHPSASEDERRALTVRFQAVTEAYRSLVA